MIRAADYFVAPADLQRARALVEQHHYACGSSRTAVYAHGLYRVDDLEMVGAALWLPPTRVAAESVNPEQWKKVVALSRLVVHPSVPKNGASFLIGRSVRLIREDGRFVTLLTYADESQGHTGAIYRATNWTYLGRTSQANYRWIDWTGKQVAQQSSKTRTKAQMEALGYIRTGPFHKHKFVMHIGEPS